MPIRLRRGIASGFFSSSRTLHIAVDQLVAICNNFVDGIERCHSPRRADNKHLFFRLERLVLCGGRGGYDNHVAISTFFFDSAHIL